MRIRPIIGLTVNVYDEDIKECTEGGMNHVIKNPVSLKDFKLAIAKNH